AGDMRRRYAGEADQHRHVVFLVEGMGADVNCSDEEGVTPLAKAAGAGHAAIVEYLLTRGADPNPEGPEWALPVAAADNHGHAQVARLLRDHAAH
ncbi:hypothetical protein HN937_04250, partial [Candidatus Poribacteria bacterium]|nr:hypothetical protein [Candidatus Poribacteria bacterium]